MNVIRSFGMARGAAPIRTTLVALIVAIGLNAGCGDSTDFVVDVDLVGTVLLDGVPFPATRVVLRDQRTVAEVGEVLGIATTDASGRYQLRARADRTGYGTSCGYMVLYVDGYRNVTELSDEIACTEVRQTIDLMVTESSSAVLPRGG